MDACAVSSLMNRAERLALVTTLSDILTAVQIGETTDWEFKSARGGFPGSFWETYSAMANSEGGVVVLGVSDKHGTVHVDGLAAGKVTTYQKTLWDGLNNRGMVSDNLLEIAAVAVVPPCWRRSAILTASGWRSPPSA